MKLVDAFTFRRAWLAVLGALLALALIAVGWLDYRSARRELTALARAHAGSVRDTVAAAARANRAAAAEAQAQLAERLLDNARLLAEIDGRIGLSPALVEQTAQRNHLFRITVLGRDGSRETFGGGPHPLGRGAGRGAGLGIGPEAAALIDRIINGGDAERVTNLHVGRGAIGGTRLAAGVRRPKGGAIVLSVDAGDVRRLQQQSSLDRLLDDVVAQTDDVAYIVFDQGDVRRSSGNVPADLDRSTADRATPQASERQLDVGGRPVLELTAPIDLGDGATAHVHLGMRLDAVRNAERRMLARLAMSLTAAAVLGSLAFGLVWLQGRYGRLSLDHARAQEALRRRDRLAAMGELASTVAHEIRNPLNAIAMSAQRLRRECFGPGAAPDRDEALGLVDVVHQEAQRIEAKVAQFLSFARPPSLSVRATALDTWATDIAKAFGAQAALRQVRFEPAPVDPAEVVIDPEQLRHAVDNLLRNALEATPAGGRVWLATRREGGDLVIEVGDTGAGIAPEQLPKIFDLYFTTKAAGTGVGLAVTQQVVTAHGGRLDVDSRPGKGTIMRIRLPAAENLAHA